MGGNPHDRLSYKDHFKSLEVELQQDYGLSRIASRALVGRIAIFIDDLQGTGDTVRNPGQILYQAVSARERPGKPVRYCLLTPVRLTLLTPGDKGILNESGTVELRKVRMCRAANEAARQGGYLSNEDLSLLLGVDISTVRRLAHGARKNGISVPTRGYMADIGPGVSHKLRVINLYFKGLGPARIASITGHSLASVERYLSDFARVVELANRGLEVEQIQRITGLISSVTRQYVSLYSNYNKPAHEMYISDLRRRFSPIT